MALKAFGSVLTVNIVPGSARATRKANGLEEAECTFEAIGDPGAAGLALETAQPLGSRHPYKAHLFMESQQIQYQPTGARMICTYAGVTFEWLEKPTYELVIGMQESPIETHPNFEDFAGKPSAPLNGALFINPETGVKTTSNTIGVFDSFLPYLSGGARNDKAGIEAYLDPTVTYRESFVSYSLPSPSGFGRISGDVPGPGFRGNLGKRNWLNVGYTYRRRGAPQGAQNQVIYEIANEWRLSGRAGWDTDVYSS